MRDFRDAKAMARTLRAALAAKSIKITIAESLELTARSLGAPDWNTLAAAIRRVEHPEVAPAPIEPPRAPEPPAVGTSPRRTTFSPELEASLYRAVSFAKRRQHQYTTLE